MTYGSTISRTGAAQQPDPRRTPQHAFPLPALRTWIMVADNKAARIFEKNDRLIDPVGKIICTDPEIRSVTVKNNADHRRRVFYYRYHRHNSYVETGGESLSFTHKIAAWLDEAIWNDAFDRMILITPPPVQTRLYHVLSAPAQARIAGVVNRDFSGMSTNDIRHELSRMTTN